MTIDHDPRVLVINLNAPELDKLALALARSGQLAQMVRPYANKERLWERLLADSPVGGRLYGQTFGRRRIADPTLARLVDEAGVFPDMVAAAIGQSRWLPDELRHRWTNALRKQVRTAVAREGARRVRDIDGVVAYEGFALPAFEAARRAGHVASLLNYPVAHHRQRRKVRDEENALEPAFASTWPGFDDWSPGHEERLDREIAMADAVLVGSTYAANSFAAEGIDAGKIQVVPYGVDLQTFSPAAEPPPLRPFRVIYAGQLTQRKGLAYLLRGYRRFQRPDSTLTLVGSVVGSRTPLEPFASLFTHVPHQTRLALAQRYRESHVFVLPTLIEGMPLVVLEAMACGLPVIVTPNGPAGIVRDGIDGYIVPQRDEEAIAERLQRLYDDPLHRAQMGIQAAARAREFGWEVYGQRMLSLIGRIAPRRAEGAGALAALPATQGR